MSESVLEIKNVSKYYGKNKVVDNVSFSVEKGQILGFLGPNGAGKTTTIKMILGLLSIDEGSIKVNGFDVKKNYEKAMEYIGGIVENPDMYGYMSAVDNLKLFAKIRNINYSEVYKVLELVGLKKSMNQKVSKYSLGMKQRAGLALSLLHSPKVLILDEPTNGLDPAGIKKLRDILKEIAHKEGVAVFVSSHILSEMQLMCDKVAVIDSGKVVKIEEITKQEEKIETVEQPKAQILQQAQPVEQDTQYYESTRVEVKPSLWQRFKQSKFVRTIKYIMKIKVVLDIPALPSADEDRR